MILAPLFLAAAAFAAEPSWTTAVDAALAQAKATGKPVLADFQAPWCYSCYYMEQRVLSKPGFAKAAEGLVPLKLDVDTAEGAAMKATHAVTFLPTYLLLSADGKELGRIVGEQTETDFLAKLSALTGGKASEDKELTALRAKSKKGDVAALEKLLERPVQCETAYDIGYAEDAVSKLYPEHRDLVLKKERKVLETLVEQKLFVPAESRCADFRSGVETLAGVDEKLGDKSARRELLSRALALLDKEGVTAGDDRNRDDNRRLFLEMQDDSSAVRAWYEKLVAAYPADYVYAFRFAKWLNKRGENAEALPWVERADKLSYGANRLAVTGVRAKILAALGRKDEALAAADRDLKSSAKVWTRERDALRGVRDELKQLKN
jgi:thioredoxin-like negative regulator of GroEL